MKMTAWRDCKLGDLLQIKHGFAFLGEHFSSTGTHIVVTPGNFLEEGGFKEKADKAKWYKGPIPDAYVLNKGDLIVAMTEQAEGLLGSSALIPRSGVYLHNQRLGLVQIRDQRQVDQHFIYYLFNSKPVRQQLRGSASGTKIRHTAPSRIADVRVKIPPPPIQRRVSGILSAYDELIDNSQRRIRVLESMARGLYREWFVHFRFPGHENHPRVASELGEIPEGWKVRALKEVATVTYGFPFQSKKFNTSQIGSPVIRIRDILNGTTTTFTDEVVDSKYHIKNGDILVGMDGDFHMSMWSGDHALQNQRVAKFESSSAIGNYHLFLALESPIQTWNKSIVGTTVAHLGDMHIKAIQIVWPTEQVLVKSNQILEPISEQIIALRRQIRNLRSTRDLLLPRLLSGQIAVKAT
jgi:type I restriction enzyme S subunit